MNSTTSFLHPGDLVAFVAGATAAAGLGFIRRHEYYVRLIALYPFLTGLDLWVHIHFFHHPANMVEYIIAAVTSTSRTPTDPADPPH